MMMTPMMMTPLLPSTILLLNQNLNIYFVNISFKSIRINFFVIGLSYLQSFRMKKSSPTIITGTLLYLFLPSHNISIINTRLAVVVAVVVAGAVVITDVVVI